MRYFFPNDGARNSSQQHQQNHHRPQRQLAHRKRGIRGHLDKPHRNIIIQFLIYLSDILLICLIKFFLLILISNNLL